jgi:hypothetical protein
VASSGTYNFGPSNSSLILESFERIRLRPTALDAEKMASARMSLNLELVDWSNSGLNLWKIVAGTINLVASQGAYSMPANLEAVTEVYFTQVNGYGTGSNNDRIMVPITRTQWAMIPNKNEPGQPTQYWFEMLATPTLTIWQPPAQAYQAPNYVISWFGLQRMQDANLGVAETPDVVYRGLEALTARLALRLLTKFGRDDPAWMAMMTQRLTAEAERAWNNLLTRDQETGPLLIQPNVGVYGKI